jgi:DNA-binding transcriptional LysR family regulator
VEWQQAFPQLHSEEHGSAQRHSARLAADGTVDLAVVDDVHARSSFVCRTLCSEPLVILTSTQNVNCPSGRIKLADVARLALVLPYSRHGLRALLNRHFESIGLTESTAASLDGGGDAGGRLLCWRVMSGLRLHRHWSIHSD